MGFGLLWRDKRTGKNLTPNHAESLGNGRPELIATQHEGAHTNAHSLEHHYDHSFRRKRPQKGNKSQYKQ